MVNGLVSVAAALGFIVLALAVRRAIGGKSRRRTFWLFESGLLLLLPKLFDIGDGVLIAGGLLLLLTNSTAGLLARRKHQPALEEYTDQPEKRPKKSRRKLLAVTAFCLSLIIVIIIWLIHLFGGSATGTIQTSAPPPTTTQTSKLVTLKTKYFTLQHPNYFHASPVSPPKPPFLVAYEFLKPQTSSWDLAIQIEALPSGDLMDDGSYHFRAVSPTRFTEQVVTIHDMNVRIMTDQTAGGGLGQAAFFTHGGLLASVSLTGGNSGDKDQMQQAYTALLNSWQWQ